MNRYGISYTYYLAGGINIVKKLIYIFPILLLIAFTVFSFALFLVSRILKALAIIFVARLDIFLPLLFGTMFSARATVDVILANFLAFESIASMSDLFAIALITSAAFSIIIFSVSNKKRITKIEFEEENELELQPNYSCAI